MWFTRREIDVVMAWFVDRLGKSLQHLVTLLSDIQSKRVDLCLDQQGIDTTTPSATKAVSIEDKRAKDLSALAHIVPSDHAPYRHQADIPKRLETNYQYSL